MVQGFEFIGLGALMLLVAYACFASIRSARRSGTIDKSVTEFGPDTYERATSPFQYWSHYWGRVFGMIVFTPAGIGAIGLGVFLLVAG